jgi:glycosyltransferase involved in cell wall biosynthesis
VEKSGDNSLGLPAGCAQSVKVMILTQGLTGGGGSEKVMSDLTLALSDRFDFVLVTPHRADRDDHSFPHKGQLIQADMKWSEPASNISGRLAKLAHRAARLRRIIVQERPDIVLSNFTYMWHAALTVLKLLGLIRAKVALRFGSPVSLDLNQRGRIYRLMTWLGVRAAERVIANSHGLAEDIIEYLGVSRKKVIVIHNPIRIGKIVSLSEEPVAEPIFNSETPVVLSVGRLSAEKNQSMLIRAFARVQPQTGSKLALVGNGPVEQDLRRLAESLGMTEHVVFLGWQENPYKFMSRAACLALSSNYEGFPSVLVEAMACGCPVISIDCSYGPAEILENGKYGILVPVGDEDALAGAMLGLLEDRASREKLAEAGRKRAQTYDADIYTEKYVNLFCEMD